MSIGMKVVSHSRCHGHRENVLRVGQTDLVGPIDHDGFEALGHFSVVVSRYSRSLFLQWVSRCGLEPRFELSPYAFLSNRHGFGF